MNIKAKEPNTTECQQHHSTDLQTKDLSLDELEHKLGASSEGLSQTEVQKRLAQYGYNELPEKETNPYQIFLPLYRFSACET